MCLPALEICRLCCFKISVSEASELNLGSSILIIIEFVFGGTVSFMSLISSEYRFVMGGRGRYMESPKRSAFPNTVSATRHCGTVIGID